MANHYSSSRLTFAAARKGSQFGKSDHSTCLGLQPSSISHLYSPLLSLLFWVHGSWSGNKLSLDVSSSPQFMGSGQLQGVMNKAVQFKYF